LLWAAYADKDLWYVEGSVLHRVADLADGGFQAALRFFYMRIANRIFQTKRKRKASAKLLPDNGSGDCFPVCRAV
jgi:hypothetical protein